VYLDLDNFKKVNDAYGHMFGDQLLQAVALAILSCLDEGQVLARLGGDEFIVALPETTQAQAESVAEKLRELSIQGLWSQHAQIGPVRLSVGLSHIRGDDTAQDVIQHADVNLYASRQAAQQRAAQTTGSHR
jgi:cyclic di-GMP phosphodiesterase Gmr